MQHKILPLILIFTLLLGTAINADSVSSCTFDEALDMILESSIEYKTKDKAIDKAKDNYETLKAKTSEEINYYIGNFKYFITDQVEPQVRLEEAYASYQQSILDRDNTKINLAVNLRSAIIAVQKAEMESEQASANKKAWEEELKLLNLRLNKNLISKTEYKTKKTELENKINGLEKTQENLDEAYYNLNSLLEREDNKDIVITLNDTVIPLYKLDLEQIRKDMLEKDTSISQKKNQRNSKKLYFDIVEKRYSEYEMGRDNYTALEGVIGSIIGVEDMQTVMNLVKLYYDAKENYEYATEKYEEVKDNYEIADSDYEKALASFNRNFDKTIKSITDLTEEIDNIKKEISEEKQNTEFYRIKYMTKMISKSEYNNKLNNLVTLQNKQKAAELDLNLKYAKLLAYSDLEKVVK